mgnify:CR=1 FL=1
MKKKFSSPIKLELDGMTPFGWEKNSCISAWDSLLDGRKFDRNNEQISRRTFDKIKKNGREIKNKKNGREIADRQEVDALLKSIEEKKNQEKWTWKKMRKLTGVHYETLKNWESGRCVPEKRKIKKISAMLGKK